MLSARKLVLRNITGQKIPEKKLGYLKFLNLYSRKKCKIKRRKEEREDSDRKGVRKELLRNAKSNYEV